MVGFSGIVDLQMEEESLRLIKFKFPDGRPLALGILVVLKKIVLKNFLAVEESKGKPYFSGHIILFFNFKIQNIHINNIKCFNNLWEN